MVKIVEFQSFLLGGTRINVDFIFGVHIVPT